MVIGVEMREKFLQKTSVFTQKGYILVQILYFMDFDEKFEILRSKNATLSAKLIFSYYTHSITRVFVLQDVPELLNNFY